MNKALLPILARLHSLQVAARMAPEGERLVASRSDPEPITVVLREINETILARRLRFASDSGSCLELEVSGRRILRLVAAEGLAGAEACLAAASLEDEHKDDLIKLLQALCKPRHEIRVRSLLVEQSEGGVSVGLPVALIADLLLAELNGFDAELVSDSSPRPPPSMPESEPEPAEPESPAVEGSLLGRFARANESVLMSWLIVGGEEDGATEGPEEMVDHLRVFLDDEAADLGKQLDRVSYPAGEPVCIVLGATLSAGHSILCARADGGVLLGLAEGDCTRVLMSAWSAALR